MHKPISEQIRTVKIKPEYELDVYKRQETSDVVTQKNT